MYWDDKYNTQGISTEVGPFSLNLELSFSGINLLYISDFIFEIS